MDGLEQPGAPKLGDNEVLQPNDVTPTAEVLSQLNAETSQAPAPEPLLKQKKSKKGISLIILAVVLALTLVGGVVWFVLGNNTSQDDTNEDVAIHPSDSENDDDNENPVDEPEPKDEIIELSVDDELVQRLYGYFASAVSPWDRRWQIYMDADVRMGNIDKDLMVVLAKDNLSTVGCKGEHYDALLPDDLKVPENKRIECYSGKDVKNKVNATLS